MAVENWVKEEFVWLGKWSVERILWISSRTTNYYEKLQVVEIDPLNLIALPSCPKVSYVNIHGSTLPLQKWKCLHGSSFEVEFQPRRSLVSSDRAVRAFCTNDIGRCSMAIVLYLFANLLWSWYVVGKTGGCQSHLKACKSWCEQKGSLHADSLLIALPHLHLSFFEPF